MTLRTFLPTAALRLGYHAYSPLAFAFTLIRRLRKNVSALSTRQFAGMAVIRRISALPQKSYPGESEVFWFVLIRVTLWIAWFLRNDPLSYTKQYDTPYHRNRF